MLIEVITIALAATQSCEQPYFFLFRGSLRSYFRDDFGLRSRRFSLRSDLSNYFRSNLLGRCALRRNFCNHFRGDLRDDLRFNFRRNFRDNFGPWSPGRFALRSYFCDDLWFWLLVRRSFRRNFGYCFGTNFILILEIDFTHRVENYLW